MATINLDPGETVTCTFANCEEAVPKGWDLNRISCDDSIGDPTAPAIWRPPPPPTA